MTLQELLERVEKATGPDRAIDTNLALMLEADEYERIKEADDRSGLVIARSEEYFGFLGAPEYTASLDAAVALVERMLPGWSWGVHVNLRAVGGFLAHVTERSPIRPMPNIGAAPTPALALIAALLRALAAKDTGQ